MVKFALVTPCPNFIEVAFDVFEAHNRMHAGSDPEQYELVEVVVAERTADAFRAIDVDADVYISRGIFAEILKSAQQEIPVAEIPVPATDLLRAIRTCQRAYGRGKVGIIAASSTVIAARDLEDLIDDDLATYPLDSPWKGPELVQQAVREGCHAILGGLYTCRYAKEHGVNSVFITTSHDSFLQGLMAAKRIMTVRRREQEKARRLQVILDASTGAVISLDTDQRVLMVNKSAERLLGITMQDIGKHVAELALAPDLGRLLLAGGDNLNELAKSDKGLLMVSTHGVRVQDQLCSTVVTCQEVGGIQAIEHNIRKKMYSKGHVAKASFEHIVGTSAVMRRTVRTAVEYSRTNSNVLLVGESGTGKEIVAQSIHNASQRRSGPFVAINCAAIPDSLLESELFGYAAGAFSGAHKGGKPGLFELAHNGTIFLDEVGEMPLHLQAKLLRAVQEREIIRLGGDTVVPVDIRIISATNQNCEQMVASGTFRIDLFFRLDVLRINIPRLDDRREDIPELIEQYLRANFTGTRMTPAGVRLLTQHAWPGNVRQLFNICERLAVLARGGVVDEDDVQAALAAPLLFGASIPPTPLASPIPPIPPIPPVQSVPCAPVAPVGETSPCADTPDGTRNAPPHVSSPVPFYVPPNVPQDMTVDAERQRIAGVLQACRYNRGQAAARLGMDRSTLWRKMSKLGL